MRRATLGFFLVLGIGFCSPFLAANAQEIRKDQGAPYVTGGIGIAERERLSAMANDFSLKARFAMQAGNYLADIQVTIEDAQGNKVIETMADGPWLLVDLNPGSYKVIATSAVADETLRKDVQVQPASSTEVLFSFTNP
ncbi:MAG: hypothetical protein QNJ06_01680 [Kiloniellales bacterium]|nr:hypothetical protein [Kiloniellales bacterium]